MTYLTRELFGLSSQCRISFLCTLKSTSLIKCRKKKKKYWVEGGWEMSQHQRQQLKPALSLITCWTWNCRLTQMDRWIERAPIIRPLLLSRFPQLRRFLFSPSKFILSWLCCVCVCEVHTRFRQSMWVKWRGRNRITRHNVKIDNLFVFSLIKQYTAPQQNQSLCWAICFIVGF